MSTVQTKEEPSKSAGKAGPRLQLRGRFLLSKGSPFQFELRLVNAGDTAAQKPAVQFETKSSGLCWPEAPKTGFVGARSVSEAGMDRILYEPDRDLVIYPGMDRLLLVASDHLGEERPWATILDSRNKDAAHVKLRGILYALDMRSTPFSLDTQIAAREDEEEIREKRFVLPSEGS